VNIGIEVVVNLLAPSAPDRYFEADGRRFPLRWSAAVPGAELRAVDEWQKVSVAFEASGARHFWISPIETVSESEDGFERIYQGSQVIAVWPVELAQGAEWKGRLTLSAVRLAL
jgi:alpha-amylase